MPTSAAAPGTINYASSTAGALANWASYIENLLIAGGWAQTADTGQTAAAALAAASATNQSKGYQCWHMTDTLQGTAPVFLKIEYGSGSYSAASAGIWVTIGTGTDGAGNITGTLLARTQVAVSSSAAANAGGFYGSAGAGRLVFAMLAAGATGASIIFSIERSKDTSGNDTATGLYVYGTFSNSGGVNVTSLNQYLRFTNNTLPNSTLIGGYVPSGSTWSNGLNFGVFFLRYFGGAPSAPGRNLALYLGPDTAGRVQVPVQCYGATQQMMPLGATYCNTAASNNANASLMIRWD